ncbi:General transcription factor II-I repeat domain-containing protein 2B [Frankliniella fusca]|uniref:General transcription factor II-I repeat domain-containing protein 2B n=1 Tax=Frankliniella fusca TaxID=407009 RepID=A0AAE1LQV2_9NEOP|nr:General transcription factor II-I repeat domain-containing protein 2B [Frankliniella fusca]
MLLSTGDSGDLTSGRARVGRHDGEGQEDHRAIEAALPWPFTVDRKIQQITRSLFRVIGRLVLGGGGGNSATAGASSSSSSGRKVSITLPTYPPGEDDDDEDEDEDSTQAASTVSPSDESSTPAETENQLSGAESQISEVRVPFDDKPNLQPAEEEEEDLKPAASGDNLADEGAADLENEADGAAEDENRNKRFLPFNLNGAAAGGGSGGGSGNFLFDIIRLIAGSGTTQAQDEAENAPLDGSTSSAGASVSASAGAEGKDDGYQEGVPGPITRLFVIANRGIANLVQDLILRLAQTSERLVNFKARLITSII